MHTDRVQYMPLKISPYRIVTVQEKKKKKGKQWRKEGASLQATCFLSDSQASENREREEKIEHIQIFLRGSFSSFESSLNDPN